MGTHLRDVEWEAQIMRDETGHDPGDPGEPEVLTVARLPTERERVGAELVAYRDRDGGEPEWHVDLIDRDRAETLISLRVGHAVALRAQIDVAIREALARRNPGGLRPVGPAYEPPGQRAQPDDD